MDRGCTDDTGQPYGRKKSPLRRLMLTCFNKCYNRYTAEGFKARQHV